MHAKSMRRTQLGSPNQTVTPDGARVLLVLTLVGALAIGCSSGDPTSGNAPTSPTITVDVTTPTALGNTSGNVHFGGTLTSSDPTVTNLTVELKVKGVSVGKAQGGTFSVDVDSTIKDTKGKPVFKDGKVCISFEAAGTLGASGTKTHCVTSDNTDPVVTFTAPEADSVHVGSVALSAVVADKYVKDINVSVDGQRVIGFCNEKLLGPDDKPLCTMAKCKAQYSDCLSGQGAFFVEINRATAPTKVVKIAIEATDMTGHTTKIERSVTVLRPPTWDVAHTFDDHPKPRIGEINDLLIYDFDQDTVLDTLIATTTGVWLMAGTKNLTTGKGVGTLQPPLQVSGAPLTRLVLVDIDGDGLKDVYGTGALSLDTPDKSGVAAFLTKKGGIRQVQQIPLEGSVRAIATGDMDRNGVMDVVAGAQEDQFAIQIVPALLPAQLLCPSAKDDKRLCKGVTSVEDLGQATIFGLPTAYALSGGISALVVADFVITGKEVYPDIAIGRDQSATLTVCPNNKGKLMACQDVQKNEFTADMTDHSLMVPVDWNNDGKMDLIVASKGAGRVRWIASLGNGKFEADPGTTRQHLLSDVTSLSVGPVGPAGKDYVMIAYGGRTVTLVPVQLDDRSHIDKCFRSWILGGSITTVRHGDLDGDGDVELIGIDRAPHGIAVALGTGDGNYHAATVHRVCGLKKGGFLFGDLPVAHFKLGDVSADGKPDLMLISNAVTSRRSRLANQCQSKTDKSQYTPQPAHVVHLYVNEGKSLGEAARAGEWGPYTTVGLQSAHAVKEKGEGTCGTAMADLSGFELGEFNGKPPMDMVLSREQDYTVGTPPDAEGDCPFKEQNEVANLFGLEKGGTDESPGPFCKNFKDEDDKKKDPLSSARGGAPLARASVVTFVNGDPSSPFGLSASNRPDDPVELRPQFMFAGGRKPIALVVGHFDADNIDDIATLMKQENDNKQLDHLAPRVRIFRGTPATEGGIVKPVLYFQQGTDQGVKYQNENENTLKLPIAVEKQDFWTLVNPQNTNGKKISVR